MSCTQLWVSESWGPQQVLIGRKSDRERLQRACLSWHTELHSAVHGAAPRAFFFHYCYFLGGRYFQKKTDISWHCSLLLVASAVTGSLHQLVQKEVEKSDWLWKKQMRKGHFQLRMRDTYGLSWCPPTRCQLWPWQLCFLLLFLSSQHHPTPTHTHRWRSWSWRASWRMSACGWASWGRSTMRLPGFLWIRWPRATEMPPQGPILPPCRPDPANQRSWRNQRWHRSPPLRPKSW